MFRRRSRRKRKGGDSILRTLDEISRSSKHATQSEKKVKPNPVSENKNSKENEKKSTKKPSSASETKAATSNTPPKESKDATSSKKSDENQSSAKETSATNQSAKPRNETVSENKDKNTSKKRKVSSLRERLSERFGRRKRKGTSSNTTTTTTTTTTTPTTQEEKNNNEDGEQVIEDDFSSTISFRDALIRIGQSIFKSLHAPTFTKDQLTPELQAELFDELILPSYLPFDISSFMKQNNIQASANQFASAIVSNIRKVTTPNRFIPASLLSYFTNILTRGDSILRKTNMMLLGQAIVMLSNEQQLYRYLSNEYNSNLNNIKEFNTGQTILEKDDEEEKQEESGGKSTKKTKTKKRVDIPLDDLLNITNGNHVLKELAKPRLNSLTSDSIATDDQSIKLVKGILNKSKKSVEKISKALSLVKKFINPPKPKAKAKTKKKSKKQRRNQLMFDRHKIGCSVESMGQMLCLKLESIYQLMLEDGQRMKARLLNLPKSTKEVLVKEDPKLGNKIPKLKRKSSKQESKGDDDKKKKPFDKISEKLLKAALLNELTVKNKNPMNKEIKQMFEQMKSMFEREGVATRRRTIDKTSTSSSGDGSSILSGIAKGAGRAVLLALGVPLYAVELIFSVWEAIVRTVPISWPIFAKNVGKIAPAFSKLFKGMGYKEVIAFLSILMAPTVGATRDVSPGDVELDPVIYHNTLSDIILNDLEVTRPNDDQKELKKIVQQDAHRIGDQIISVAKKELGKDSIFHFQLYQHGLSVMLPRLVKISKELGQTELMKGTIFEGTYIHPDRIMLMGIFTYGKGQGQGQENYSQFLKQYSFKEQSFLGDKFSVSILLDDHYNKDEEIPNPQSELGRMHNISVQRQQEDSSDQVDVSDKNGERTINIASEEIQQQLKEQLFEVLTSKVNSRSEIQKRKNGSNKNNKKVQIKRLNQKTVHKMTRGLTDILPLYTRKSKAARTMHHDFTNQQYPHMIAHLFQDIINSSDNSLALLGLSEGSKRTKRSNILEVDWRHVISGMRSVLLDYTKTKDINKLYDELATVMVSPSTVKSDKLSIPTLRPDLMNTKDKQKRMGEHMKRIFIRGFALSATDWIITESDEKLTQHLQSINV